MNKSPSLQLTAKGEDELERRAHGLSVKRRSLIILLSTPQTIDELLKRMVLPEAEFRTEISALVEEGFIAYDAALPPSLNQTPSPPRAATPVPSDPGATTLPAQPEFRFDEDIFLAEAKFLLADFCVDSFGTESQTLIDEVHGCTDVQNFAACFATILTATSKRRPEHVPTLMSLVQQINDTA